MALMWAITIGFIFSLGLVGFMLVHFLKGAMDSRDSTAVDRIQSNSEE
ncbi:hypothetical protein ACOSZF_04790 [Cytobacillus firmus]|uniref:Uncharacterized protein n=1 Tax=Cytobacillus firmus TaxID=1399 RepID=A0A380XFX5_CYTFI|nr:hypothetical protein [Cytobacillus firmus]KAF0825412.1 hypothetical protein KIS1582_0719 [Cytobacillus firmus]MDD9313594.1 hypothetical protein [Cytobacillus firmus]MEC1892877.1 hypothetical protein [Cytobacillus firmus]MED1906232.1 hypothetical protein [Cytobacillus firmus]MED1940068.1 hypothetical protein [Cytobacillus firmus]